MIANEILREGLRGCDVCDGHDYVYYPPPFVDRRLRFTGYNLLHECQHMQEAVSTSISNEGTIWTCIVVIVKYIFPATVDKNLEMHRM